MALFREHSDVSVRPATPGDDDAVAAVQLRAWQASHGELLGAEVLEHLDVDAIRQQWSQAIGTPPSSEHRVLVACDGPRVIGFAASAPVEDGVEVVALEVDPDHQRGGHGSRLLAACVDLARDRGSRHLQTWVLEGDEARERFLSGAGLGADGVQRELGMRGGPEARTVCERRWVAEI